MKKSFSWRILTSYTLFLSFLILLISGVILYVYPGVSGSGFVTNFGGFTKPAWLNQHIIFSLVFTLFALYHLFFVNRTAFLSYLTKKKAEGFRRPAELLVTVMVTSCVAIGTYVHMQPFSSVLSTGKEIAGSLERSEGEAPAININENVSEYVERAHRHDFEKDDDENHASVDLASRLQESKEPVSQGLNSTPDSISQSVNNGAPNDELHRRTKASCASCH
jgi:hypothetical protein